MTVEAGIALVDAAITMTRFPWGVTAARGAAAISSDGTKLATVVWRGDLDRNVNVYSLLIIDITRAREHPRMTPLPLLSIDFHGDPQDQVATPIADVIFTPNGRTVAFLGSLSGEPRQVHAIDIDTGECRRLTDHPTNVRSFVLRADGSLALYAVATPDPSGDRADLIENDGLLVMDRELFPERPPFSSGYVAVWADKPRETRQYLLVSADREPVLVFDSRRSRPPSLVNAGVNSSGAIVPTATLDDEHLLRHLSSLTPDPTGRYALLWPYALADEPVLTDRYPYFKAMNPFRRGLCSYYGLVDLSSGDIERFADAPHSPLDRASGRPVWAPEGGSAFIYTLLPIDGSDIDGAGQATPRWAEVDLVSRSLRSLDLPEDWQVESWSATTDLLILRKGQELASLRHHADGSWVDFQRLATTVGFQDYPEVVTDGEIIVGSRETPLEPPELAFYEVSKARLTIATDLNPELRTRQYAEVEEIEWSGDLTTSRGYLVKPYGYQPETRYALAFLLDDGVLRRNATPFLLDGGVHLSGHPVQALAARGIAVLYTREPPTMREVSETPAEGEHMRDHVESAIRYLDQLGMIDPARVGLSGWSRAAYYTDYLLIHSSRQFAAATQIDGGAVDYLDRGRPFYDTELKGIRTPILFEAHGPASYISMASMADRLNALGGAAEILYFPKAPHSVINPRHRRRSLTVHLDWYCFWLAGEVDSDLTKERQYDRWSELRHRLLGITSRTEGSEDE